MPNKRSAAKQRIAGGYIDPNYSGLRAHVMLENGTFDAVRKLAIEEQRSFSKMVSVLVVEALRKRRIQPRKGQ